MASASQQPKSRFLCIGHRGARGHAPENTLASIDKAISLGCDMIEFDVQRTSDGHLVLIHDPRLDRTTNGTGRVAESTLQHLRSLDAGQGETIPTLNEALHRINRQAAVNIEIKSANGTATAIAAEVARFLASGWSPTDFLVSSFHVPELIDFQKALPQVPIATLICGVPVDLAASAEAVGAAALNISHEFADKRLIDDAHIRGLAVYVYTVNDAQDIADLIVAGADGVFSDWPDRVMAARSRAAENRSIPG